MNFNTMSEPIVSAVPVVKHMHINTHKVKRTLQRAGHYEIFAVYPILDLLFLFSNYCL